MKHALTLAAIAVTLSLTGCESSGYSKGSAAKPILVRLFEMLNGH